MLDACPVFLPVLPRVKQWHWNFRIHGLHIRLEAVIRPWEIFVASRQDRTGRTVRGMKAATLIAAVALGFAGPALAADPKAIFMERCSMCHQSAGQGLAGQFPRLAGRAAQIAQTPEGRNYLIRAVLWGVYGTIDVDGTQISGLMPSMAPMTDAEISAVLNHVIALGKPAKPAAPFKPADIAAVRAKGTIAGSDNFELRKKLVAAGLIK